MNTDKNFSIRQTTKIGLERLFARVYSIMGDGREYKSEDVFIYTDEETNERKPICRLYKIDGGYHLKAFIEIGLIEKIPNTSKIKWVGGLFTDNDIQKMYINVSGRKTDSNNRSKMNKKPNNDLKLNFPNKTNDDVQNSMSTKIVTALEKETISTMSDRQIQEEILLQLIKLNESVYTENYLINKKLKDMI